MEIFALVGASGTGKSFIAMDIAKLYAITHIIDDGILISEGKKIAGKSAKAENSMVGAVKRAIFLDASHAKNMKEAILQENPKKILILGTSEHMIDRIIESLALPHVSKILFIEDVSTKENIELAQEMRGLGKHVIPLPTVEVKKDLKNQWINPVVDFFSRKNKKASKSIEKSIVRPTFSELGKITIAEQVVSQLTLVEIKKTKLFSDHLKINSTIENFGVKIFFETKIVYGNPIEKSVRLIQRAIKESLEDITGLDVIAVNVCVVGVF